MTAPALRPLERAILDCGMFDTRTELVICDLLEAAYELGKASGQAHQVDTLPDVYRPRALPAPDDYRERREYREPVIIGGRYDR